MILQPSEWLCMFYIKKPLFCIYFAYFYHLYGCVVNLTFGMRLKKKRFKEREPTWKHEMKEHSGTVYKCFIFVQNGCDQLCLLIAVLLVVVTLTYSGCTCLLSQGHYLLFVGILLTFFVWFYHDFITASRICYACAMSYWNYSSAITVGEGKIIPFDVVLEGKMLLEGTEMCAKFGTELFPSEWLNWQNLLRWPVSDGGYNNYAFLQTLLVPFLIDI